MKKYQKIYRHLSSIIDDLPPGGKLPSVRELMLDCNVSQVTITRAFKDIKKERRIISRIGEGSFKIGNNSHFSRVKAKNIVLVLPDYPSAFTSAICTCFKSCYSEKNYELKVINYDSQRRQISRSMIKGNVDAMIIYCNSGFDITSINSIAEFGFPVVFINIIPQGVNFDAVCTDNEFGGALAADHLLKNGHRKIAMLLAQPPGVSVANRRRGYECQVSLAQIKDLRIIDCNTVSGENSTENAYKAMCEIIDGGNLDFSAVFADSDLGALGVLKACHDKGVKVPEELNIIGFDNMPECNYFHPSLSSIDQNLQQWGIESEKIISKRINGNIEKAIHVYVKPSIKIRQSTQNKEITK